MRFNTRRHLLPLLLVLAVAPGLIVACERGSTPGPTVVESPDGKARLVIPAGAVPAGVTITIAVAAPGAAPAGAIGDAYVISPAGTTFSPAAALTLTYDPDDLPAGADADDLAIARAVAGEWSVLDSSHAAGSPALTAQITSLSIFGVVVAGGEEPVDPVDHTLDIGIDGEGAVTPASGTQYEAGTTASLTASPAAGWEFAGWAGTHGAEVAVAVAGWQILMDGDKSVVAVFVQPGPRDLLVPDVYPTIQGAIDAAAAAGDTIIVAAGIYVESLDFLGKTIELRSSDPADPLVREATVIEASEWNEPVIRLTGGEGAGTIVTGFTIRGAADPFVVHDGILVGGGSSVLIQDNVIHGIPSSTAAVQVEDGSSAHIHGNVIHNNPTLSGGIVVNQASAVVVDNVIANNIHGIAAFEATSLEIEGNEIADNGLPAPSSYPSAGIYVRNSVFVRILDNDFTNNIAHLNHGTAALAVVGENQDVLIEGNLFESNTGAAIVSLGEWLDVFRVSGTYVVHDNRILDNIAPGSSSTVYVSKPYPLSEELLDLELSITGNLIGNNVSGSGSLWVNVREPAEVVISHNQILNNTGASFGAGGIVLNMFGAGASGLVRENTIHGNTGGFVNAGGMHVIMSGGELTIEDNVITDNDSAHWVGGLDLEAWSNTLTGDPSHVIVRHNIIDSNVAGGDGGGARVHVDLDSEVVFHDNDIDGNVASGHGGGLVPSQGPTGLLRLFDNTITNNTSGDRGGGVFIGNPDRRPSDAAGVQWPIANTPPAAAPAGNALSGNAHLCTTAGEDVFFSSLGCPP